MKKVLYFAYGSNLLQERLEKRVGKVVKIGVYNLQNYKLVFNANSGLSRFTPSFANIIPSVGSVVEGVLYEMSEKQFHELDFCEALYYRYFFNVDENTLGCVYICTQKHLQKTNKPELLYLNLLLDGCLENNLKFTYNSLLDFKLRSFKLKDCRHVHI